MNEEGVAMIEIVRGVQSTEAASGKRYGIAATPQTIVTSDLYIYTYPAMREVDPMEYE